MPKHRSEQDTSNKNKANRIRFRFGSILAKDKKEGNQSERVVDYNLKKGKERMAVCWGFVSVRGVLRMAAFAGAFDGDETDDTKEKHDYADYDSECYYIHSLSLYPTITLIIFFFFLVLVLFSWNYKD